VTEVKAHAAAIVARTKELADQAAALFEVAKTRASEIPDDVSMVLRDLESNVGKTQKASGSAVGSASLLDLDEDAAGALITLDMVTGAESQAFNAASAVAEGIRTIDRRIAARRLEAEATEEAIKKARAHADQALEAATEAFDIATALEALATGGLAGHTTAYDSAFRASETAHRAATKSSDALDQAKEAESAREASSFAAAAQSGSEEAIAARDQARAARADADRATETAALAAAAEAEDLSARAVDAAESAEQAVERASEAMKIASTADSKAHHATATERASAARRAADRAQSALAEEETDKFDAVAKIRECLAEAEEAAAAARESSDQVIHLAGAAAERAAALSKSHSDAEALSEQATREAHRAEVDIERLLNETAKLTGHRVHSRRDDAVASLGQAKALAEEITKRATTAQSLNDLAEAEAVVAELRATVQTLEAHVEAALATATRTRELAEDELAEIRQREADAKAVQEAQTAAETYAIQCQEHVNEAREMANAMSDALKTTDIERAVELRDHALEIIDIAEFQAGEARSSAEFASTEADPTEARAHAETARSFSERIATDLPEAHTAFEEAEELANREIRQFARAREATATAVTAVTDGIKSVQDMLDDANTRCQPWTSDPGVTGALANLQALIASFDEDRTEAQYAADRVEQVRTGDDALEMVPVALGVAERVASKIKLAETQLDGVDKAIAAAEAEAKATHEARMRVQETAKDTHKVLDTIRAASARLEAAVAEHRAVSNEVEADRTKMAQALKIAEAALQACRASSEAADTSTTSAEAEAQATIARTALQKAEAQQEKAAEAETAGMAAAEREERERQEALALQITNAREEAHANATRTRLIADKLADAIRDAADEFPAGARDALAAKADAERAAQSLSSLASKAEAAAKISDQADEADDASDKAAAIRKMADLAEQRAEAGHKILLDAIDLARQAQAEAEALVKVRAEVEATVGAANAAVDAAKNTAKEILAANEDKVKVRAWVEQAATHIANAKKAAKKVEASAPLVVDAEDLLTANGILRTCRATVQRTEEQAEAVRGLLQQAADDQKRADEASAQELTDARSRAVEPAQEATAAARKAAGWLETGQREAEGFPEAEVVSALGDLEATVGQVVQIAAEADAAAAPAATAETVEEALAVETTIREIVERARSAAAECTTALEAVRSATELARQTRRAVQYLKDEAEELVETIGQAASQANAVADDLDRVVGALEQPSAATLEALAQAKAGATTATDAQTKAASAPKDSDLEAWQTHVDALQDLLATGIGGLEIAVDSDTACREAIEVSKREVQEAAKRATEEAKKAAEEAQEAKSKQKANEANERDAARRARLEERRSRFQRRRKEGATSTPASTASLMPGEDDSNDLTSGPPRKRSERPRRTGRRRPRDAEPDPDSPDSPRTPVRSWTPGGSGTTKATAASSRPRRSRPRGDRPGPSRPGSDSGADKLLERLRKRKSEDRD